MQNKGIDQLTKTLNDYLGAIVEGIVNSEGDVLKFAGKYIDKKLIDIRDVRMHYEIAKLSVQIFLKNRHILNIVVSVRITE